MDRRVQEFMFQSLIELMEAQDRIGTCPSLTKYMQDRKLPLGAMEEIISFLSGQNLVKAFRDDSGIPTHLEVTEFAYQFTGRKP